MTLTIAPFSGDLDRNSRANKNLFLLYDKPYFSRLHHTFDGEGNFAFYFYVDTRQLFLDKSRFPEMLDLEGVGDELLSDAIFSIKTELVSKDETVIVENTQENTLFVNEDHPFLKISGGAKYTDARKLKDFNLQARVYYRDVTYDIAVQNFVDKDFFSPDMQDFAFELYNVVYPGDETFNLDKLFHNIKARIEVFKESKTNDIAILKNLFTEELRFENELDGVEYVIPREITTDEIVSFTSEEFLGRVSSEEERYNLSGESIHLSPREFDVNGSLFDSANFNFFNKIAKNELNKEVSENAIVFLNILNANKRIHFDVTPKDRQETVDVLLQTSLISHTGINHNVGLSEMSTATSFSVETTHGKRRPKTKVTQQVATGLQTGAAMESSLEVEVKSAEIDKKAVYSKNKAKLLMLVTVLREVDNFINSDRLFFRRVFEKLREGIDDLPIQLQFLYGEYRKEEQSLIFSDAGEPIRSNVLLFGLLWNNFKNLVNVEYLEAQSSTFAEAWTPLKKSIIEEIPAGQKILCRLNPYLNNDLGVIPTEKTSLPIYNRYFYIEK